MGETISITAHEKTTAVARGRKNPYSECFFGAFAGARWVKGVGECTAIRSNGDFSKIKKIIKQKNQKRIRENEI